VTRTIELAADGVDLLSLHAANPARYPYLLESRAEQKGDEGLEYPLCLSGGDALCG